MRVDADSNAGRAKLTKEPFSVFIDLANEDEIILPFLGPSGGAVEEVNRRVRDWQEARSEDRVLGNEPCVPRPFNVDCNEDAAWHGSAESRCANLMEEIYAVRKDSDECA